MKKLFLILTLSVLTTGLRAEPTERKTVKTYIEILAVQRGSTPTIDTGNGKYSEQYKTEEGEVIVFNTVMGAVNWFVSQGWKLESVNMSAGDDRLARMYVVSKEIPVEEAKSKEINYIKK